MFISIKEKLKKRKNLKGKRRPFQNKKPIPNNSTPESLRYGTNRRTRSLEPSGQLKYIRKLEGSSTVYDNIESAIENLTLTVSYKIRLNLEETKLLLIYDDELLSLYKEINQFYNLFLPKEKQYIFDYKWKQTTTTTSIDFNKAETHKEYVKELFSIINNKENLEKTILTYDYVLEMMFDFNNLLKILSEEGV